MRIRSLYIFLIIQVLFPFLSNGQKDTERPAAPLLKIVTVSQTTGNPELSWSLSSSPDVSGYVVYSWKNHEGYALDTLYNPMATTYVHYGSGASYFTELYVVAALDSSGNISPLSNELGTIFSGVEIDTCNKKIEISWNSYSSYPTEVQNYSVLYSVNYSGFSEAGLVDADKTSFTLSDFETDSEYCFLIRANLDGGLHSLSNIACLHTKMQKPPVWINADYATLGQENDILLSFTIDPASEIETYTLQKKTGFTGSFEEIAKFTSIYESVLYSDKNADTGKVNFYRLSAINNCNNPVLVSNISSNIVLRIERNEDIVTLKWNPYREWRGISGYSKLFIKKGTTFEESYSVLPGDTVFTLFYSNIMYDITSPEVCFMVKAYEDSNPFGINGESRSSIICIPLTENISVPNTFTPDNNLINDRFRPVLSFTPASYNLIITDLQRNTLFETTDSETEWDGTKNGSRLPEGVYLWFLKITTPSGKKISRSGTLSLIINR